MLAVVACQSHNLEVMGSTPIPATIKEDNMEKKTLRTITAPNLRQLIGQANDLELQKDSIVTIISPEVHGGEFSLVYFN